MLCRPRERHQLVLRAPPSGPAATIRAGRPVRLTVCYSWGCPSSALAGTAPSPRSSVPGTTSLPLQREKRGVRSTAGKETPHLAKSHRARGRRNAEAHCSAGCEMCLHGVKIQLQCSSVVFFCSREPPLPLSPRYSLCCFSFQQLFRRLAM